MLRAPDEARMSAPRADPRRPGSSLPSRRTILGLAAAAAVLGLGNGGRAGAASDAVETDEIGDQVQRLPPGRLPVFASDPGIGRLYRFAVDRPDVLQYMPCFCGCGRLGHRDNRGCYVKAEHGDGTVTYTSHAAT